MQENKHWRRWVESTRAHPPASAATAQKGPEAERATELPRPQHDEAPWQHTSVVKTLWPPQSGTLAQKKRYGAALVCVRYRQDPQGAYRYTTVELLVDHACVRHRKDDGKTNYLLPLPYWDEVLRSQLLAEGAKWNADEQAWMITKTAALKLGVLRQSKKIKNKTMPT